ncbi:MAG TPA: serine/threonine-protein kinase [Kofleriaceae bacterium]|nr:serine/threonine-protein kinase [Kofleriaceae bacterium]
MDPQQGPPQPDFLIGQTIGNYRVTEKLGEGGMGSVYLAEHPAIGKKVALKVLHSEFSNNQDVAARFFNEARAVNDIGHPNIVDIVDFGILQASGGRDQLVYFIMEYLAGVTLSQLIRTEAPLPPERALQIGIQVADALAASHRCGIVHRDLKPDNIILLQRGRERDFVKLLDFGIAKLTGGSAMGSHRTRTGIVMGTPAYMSPEQCEGKDSVDLRTDIYALGIVMYEMLTGRVPFLGEGYGEILVQHLTQPPTPVSRFRMLPAHVEAVVMKALEKRADLRYPNMDEFMRAMADPVGYVEAHGGVAEFAKRPLMPSSAPLPSTIRIPPPLTPPPGAMNAPTYPGNKGPATHPGQSTPPTPLPIAIAMSQPGTVPPTSGRGSSKLGFVIAGGLVVAAAVIAIVIVARGGNDKLAELGSGSAAAPVVMNAAPGSDSGSAKPEPASTATGSAGSGSAASAGSAAAGSGSAASAAGSDAPPPPTIPDTGSAAAVGSGSAAPTEAASASDDHVEISVISTPPGAHIYVDGADSHQVTPAKIEVAKAAGKKVGIALRLKGYVNSPALPVDTGARSELRYELKAKPTSSAPSGVPTSSSSNSHTGSNKPSQPANNNTDPDGLMRP